MSTDTMSDFWKDVREHKREMRDRIGIDCPGCTTARPKAIPTRLMPGRKCKVCGMTYERAKKARGE